MSNNPSNNQKQNPENPKPSGQEKFDSFVSRATQVTKLLNQGVKSAKSIIDLIKYAKNDKQWFLSKGPVTPAVNDSRPMNPIYNIDITEDPTISGIPKYQQLYVNWNGLHNTMVLDTVAYEVLEKIRMNLKSNLTYNADVVKQYIVNSIALHIMCAQVKKSLTFRKFSPVHAPQIYELFKKRIDVASGYGLTNTVEIPYVQDDVIGLTSEIYDTIVDLVWDKALLPVQMAEFIDHYFGLVFRSDKDDSNCQYFDIIANSVDWVSKDNTVNVINIVTMTPNDILYYVKDFISRFAVLAADVKKAADNQMRYSGIPLPTYSALKPVTYYDPTFLQMLVNAYTSDSAIQDNKFIRLDYMKDARQDELTTYVFNGALNKVNATSPLFVPLPQVVCAAILVHNHPYFNWGTGLIQDIVGGTIDDQLITGDVLAIVYDSSINADTYVNVGGNGSETLSNGETYSGEATDVVLTFASTATSLALKATLYRGKTDFEEITRNGTGILFIPVFRASAGAWVGSAYRFTATYNVITGYMFENFEWQGDLLVSIPDTSVVSGRAIMYTSEFFQNIAAEFGNTTVAQAPDVGEPLIQLNASSINMTSYIDEFGEGDNPVIYVGVGYTPADFKVIINNYFVEVRRQVYIVPHYPTLISIQGIYVVDDASTSSLSVVQGYSNLAQYVVENMDYHLPILSRNRIQRRSGVNSNYVIVSDNVDLLKEVYIPFWYSVEDLTPVGYNMLRSLFNYFTGKINK